MGKFPCITFDTMVILIAERLSARHLILLRGRLMFVHIDVHAAWEREHAVWERVAIHVPTYIFVRVRVCVSCTLLVFLGLH